MILKATAACCIALAFMTCSTYKVSAQIDSTIHRIPHIEFADSSTHLYVVRGADSLYLNFYHPKTWRKGHPTVVYLYGGAFINGHRNDKLTRIDANALLQDGYAVAAMDYRKFFAGIDFNEVPRSQMLDILDSAFNYAAADCAAAVAYLVNNAASLDIDTAAIILAGSSAGAISVLQLDFARCNGLATAAELPEGFRPAAVVAYAGAIFNHCGPLEYAVEPAPTAFFYGEIDKVVPYRCISLFRNHYGGGECLTSIFEENNYVYWTFRYKKHGHEVSGYLHRTMAEFNAFVDAILAGRRVHYETECADDELKITPASRYKLTDLIKRTGDEMKNLFD